MNTGKIMIGFSLIMLSIAMMISPSGATVLQNSCDVGSGNFLPGGEIGELTGMHPGSPAVFILSGPRTDATYPYER